MKVSGVGRWNYENCKEELFGMNAVKDISMPRLPANVLTSRGFSLVEVLVAAAILCIAIVAVVTMVRKAGDLQVSNDYRLKARAIINARMETVYNHFNYAIIEAPDTATEPVTIDMRTGDIPLVGTLYTTVTADNPAISGTNIPIKKITLSLAWDTFDGGRDSISISKWLTE